MDSVSNNNVNFEQIGLRTNPVNEEELSEADEFMVLLLAQIENQDPMEPMENGEFLSQLAQINTASGIADLQTSFDKAAESLQSNQALQASSMVGRSVVIPSDISPLSNGKLAGAVVVPEGATQVDIKIYNLEGVLAKSINLGALDEGINDFEWNGIADNGQLMPEGEYEMRASVRFENGLSEAAQTMANAVVESVTIGSGGQGLALNLDGLGSWKMSDVIQIHQ